MFLSVNYDSYYAMFHNALRSVVGTIIFMNYCTYIIIKSVPKLKRKTYALV